MKTPTPPPQRNQHQDEIGSVHKQSVCLCKRCVAYGTDPLQQRLDVVTTHVVAHIVPTNYVPVHSLHHTWCLRIMFRYTRSITHGAYELCSGTLAPSHMVPCQSVVQRPQLVPADLPLSLQESRTPYSSCDPTINSPMELNPPFPSVEVDDGVLQNKLRVALHGIAFSGYRKPKPLSTSTAFPTSEKQSSDTHETPYNREKPCQELRMKIFSYLVGAPVAEQLTCSSPTKANRDQSPAGSPDFRKWESRRTMPLVGGFSRGSPASPTLSFRRCSITTSISLIGSQDLAVKSHPNIFTHSLLKRLHFSCGGGVGRGSTSTPRLRPCVAEIAGSSRYRSGRCNPPAPYSFPPLAAGRVVGPHRADTGRELTDTHHANINCALPERPDFHPNLRPGLESSPCPPECESNVVSLRHLARCCKNGNYGWRQVFTQTVLHGCRRPLTVDPAEKRGSIKNDNTTLIKCAIAPTHKALKLRAVFSSCCQYLWNFQRERGEVIEWRNLAALNIGVLRADEGEVRCVWSSAGMQERGKREVPQRKPAD
ncbi:hypothetical protein PR048_000556 [Dryococelus australis]|uniref:Uncharacterized protein n=1 Tax=Dryococelus australis TaxID=614101 RepID=A0ABQ9IF37_9NEOP|nr:hypothetical protein PR048_000556 [Dryococelus australis]